MSSCDATLKYLSKYGSGRQLELAAEFINYILQRAEEEGKEVYKKVSEIIDEGKARGFLTLKGFVKEVGVDGRRHVVKVIDGGAVEEEQGGKTLLRIRITAEVDGIRHEYAITFGKYRDDNETTGFAYARADAPGGREADAERFSALVEALTDKKPRVYRMKNGNIMIECGSEHLEGFKRFAELADALERWLKEMSR